MVCSWRRSRRAVSGTVSRRGASRTDEERIDPNAGKMNATRADRRCRPGQAPTPAAGWAGAGTPAGPAVTLDRPRRPGRVAATRWFLHGGTRRGRLAAIYYSGISSTMVSTRSASARFSTGLDVVGARGPRPGDASRPGPLARRRRGARRGQPEHALGRRARREGADRPRPRPHRHRPRHEHRAAPGRGARRADGRPAPRRAGRRAGPSGWERRILSPVLPGVEFELMRTTIAPGVDAGTFTPHARGSREYLAVERGTLQLTVDGTTHTLRAGDSAYYAATATTSSSTPAASSASTTSPWRWRRAARTRGGGGCSGRPSGDARDPDDPALPARPRPTRRRRPGAIADAEAFRRLAHAAVDLVADHLDGHPRPAGLHADDPGGARGAPRAPLPDRGASPESLARPSPDARSSPTPWGTGIRASSAG